jgi:hypothetical protein
MIWVMRDADLEIALNAAARVMAGGRFDLVACASGDAEAARRTTAVADVFVAWLRRPVTLSLSPVGIREQGTTEPFTPIERQNMSVVLDTSEEAVFDILAKDDRGFVTKSALTLDVSGENITAEIVETPDLNTPNQLVVRAVAPGAGGQIVLDVPDDDEIPAVSESFDVNAGGVASLALGTPTIREQGTTEPAPV